MSDKPPSTLGWLKAAVLAPANLIGLTGAVGATLVTGQTLPVAVAGALEAFYLVVVGINPRFRRAARSTAGPAGGEAEVESLLLELAPSQREHYHRLRDLKEKIEANYRRLPGGRVLAASSESRVDALLTSFLRLLSTLNGYRRYLSVADRQALEAELKELQADVAAEGSARLREVKQKRVEILSKRLQRFTQAEESRAVVSHQLASIEDLLRLTHEQSIAIRDPEHITRQLDVLSVEVQATEDTVREMEKFMDFADETAAPLPHGVRVR
ncbi:MAG: hypothetical protein ACLPJH_04970 [Myxococcaceae bacterium]